MELKDWHKQIAYLEATGQFTNIEIGEKLGHTANRVAMIKSTPEYKHFKTELDREIRERVIASISNLAEKFDLAADEAFDTLKELNKLADKDSTRVKAADSILDRAPNAPKRVKQAEVTAENTNRILLGVQVFENMQKALSDTGNSEIVDLIDRETGQFSLPEPEIPPKNEQISQNFTPTLPETAISADSIDTLTADETDEYFE